jgi:hypothetical protein
MKPNTFLVVVLTGILFMSQSDAEAQGAIIDWQGDEGYRARITMTYDASLPLVFARGGYPLSSPTNHGITLLSVQFFPPSSSTPLYTTQNISNSVVTYKFLMLYLDTVSRNLTGSLDVGRDSFAENDPGSSLGQYHLNGPVSAPFLINSYTPFPPVDSGGQFTTTIVPEPSTWALGAIGFAMLTSARRLRRF